MISLTKDGTIDIEINGLTINVTRQQFDALHEDVNLFKSIKTHNITVKPECLGDQRSSVTLAIPSITPFMVGDYVLLTSNINWWTCVKSVTYANQPNSDQLLAILELVYV